MGGSRKRRGARGWAGGCPGGGDPCSGKMEGIGKTRDASDGQLTEGGGEGTSRAGQKKNGNWRGMNVSRDPFQFLPPVRSD